jgi:hypothetical protein
LTGSVAEEASIAAQQSRQRVLAFARAFDRLAKNKPPVIVALLRKTGQILEGLSRR